MAKEQLSAEESVRISSRLRIAVSALWIIAFVFAVMDRPVPYRIFALLTAVAAAALIRVSRPTQGHYQEIAHAYFIGSIAWALCEFFRLFSLLNPGSELLKTTAERIAYAPLLFFAIGLVLFSNSEYNRIHFWRMILHTSVVAFLSFMIVQKLVLFRWGRMEALQLEMMGIVLYFFVIVFTVVLVIAIFIQTGFKGHTKGTNASAVIIIIFCFIELRWLYLIVTGQPDVALIWQAIELLGLPIYSYAQSDPKLVERAAEEDALEPGIMSKSWVGWVNAGVIFIIGVILYAAGFFDARDIYLILLADMSYIVLYKSIQASIFSEQLIEQQQLENQRLEEMVEEKTRELRQMNEELERASVTDELTGLYNRRFGSTKAASLIEKGSSAEGGRFAFMIMDLDHFKQINDSYGHDIGDAVLKEVSRRLMELSDETVTVIRVGGDEFVLLKSETPGDERSIREETEDLAKELCRRMDEPVKTPGLDVPIAACAGIALWPTDADNSEDLYKLADQAMYDIKHNVKHSSYSFIEDMEKESSEK